MSLTKPDNTSTYFSKYSSSWRERFGSLWTLEETRIARPKVLSTWHHRQATDYGVSATSSENVWWHRCIDQLCFGASQGTVLFKIVFDLQKEICGSIIPVIIYKCLRQADIVAARWIGNPNSCQSLLNNFLRELQCMHVYSVYIYIKLGWNWQKRWNKLKTNWQKNACFNSVYSKETCCGRSGLYRHYVLITNLGYIALI